MESTSVPLPQSAPQQPQRVYSDPGMNPPTTCPSPTLKCLFSFFPMPTPLLHKLSLASTDLPSAIVAESGCSFCRPEHIRVRAWLTLKEVQVSLTALLQHFFSGASALSPLDCSTQSNLALQQARTILYSHIFCNFLSPY